ncbi:hypothetical protein EMCG_06141 [[Emmonsia] crescens]|uniref:Uncharacterized protein n=1 Tax=[Emmonsia] crescens TaxID=73230 RepID=A0A0G2ID16_9EURO|nr:hypothetical protein EMCG_06141 [Emmonsia crescens UAMH 3008]
MTESGVLTPSAKSVLLGFAGGVSTLESLAPVAVSLRSMVCRLQCAVRIRRRSSQTGLMVK